MNRVLVTGGAGFLGSHLCDRLIARGDDVVCIDNFFSGHKDNIRPLLAHPYFELIRHDVIHPLFVEVDRIFHLACPASPIHYQQNPIKTVKTNVMGTINMLGLAKRIRSPDPAHLHVRRSTATPRSTPSPRATGATSTRSASGAATTKASASPRRS